MSETLNNNILNEWGKNLQPYQKELLDNFINNKKIERIFTSKNTTNTTNNIADAYYVTKFTCLICQGSFEQEEIIVINKIVNPEWPAQYNEYTYEYNCINCWEALNFSKAARPKTLKETNLEAKLVEIANSKKFVSMDDIKKIKNIYSKNGYFYDYKTNFIKP